MTALEKWVVMPRNSYMVPSSCGYALIGAHNRLSEHVHRHNISFHRCPQAEAAVRLSRWHGSALRDCTGASAFSSGYVLPRVPIQPCSVPLLSRTDGL